MSKLNKNYSLSWLLPAIKTGLFACLFMPLIVSGKFIFPYIFPKQAFFQIIVEIVFALYLFLAFKNPDYRPRSSWLFKALGIYFVLMVLSSIFGVNTYHSFWSNYERMAGVVSLFHYLGFLFVAANVFLAKKDWHLFFDISIFASVLQALYGLGQILGLFASTGGIRLDGTIGNASFLAGYMLLNALFALWLVLEKSDWRWRLSYSLVIVLNLFVMFQTETRGAMVGFLASIFFLAVFFIFARQQDLLQLPFSRAEKIRKYIIGAFIVCLAVIGAIWLARDSGFVTKQPTLYRLTHISASEGTGLTRILAWKLSFRGFQDRPLLGWGPENYYVMFNKYYDPNLYPVESWFDRAHNAFLDVLINTGLIGLLSYLAIFVLAFWSMWRAWRQEKIKYYTAVIFSVILIAYAIQNFFVFDTQVTLLMIYSILAFIVWLSFSPGQEPSKSSSSPNALFVSLVVLAVIFSMYFCNIKPGLASSTSINALDSLRSSKVEESLAQLKTALDIGTFGLPEVAMRAQDAAMNLSSNSTASTEVKEKFAELAIDGMKRSLQQEPLNARFMMMLASVYLVSAQTDNSYLSDADILLQQAMELSPNRQELFFYVGQVRMFQGKGEEALTLFKKAVELNEKADLPHWNYGVIAIGVGQKDLGEKEIQAAKDLGHSFAGSDIKQLINAYGRTNDLPKIKSLYEEWISLFPNDPVPYASLASFYAQSGQKQKAKDLALQAAAIDPSYQEQAAQFIKGLGL
ncbi:MAG TPA: O-antigen ligase family protein [Candidatus Portnoybacteria bacterium]|nr:O-antigen ligase family protein [Candidatus Portnoybacteria bacterium]